MKHNEGDPRYRLFLRNMENLDQVGQLEYERQMKEASDTLSTYVAPGYLALNRSLNTYEN